MTTSTLGPAGTVAGQLGQLAGQLTQSGGPCSQRRGQLVDRAGLAAVGEGAGQAAGQIPGGLSAGQQRRQHHPPLGHAGPGGAAARRAAARTCRCPTGRRWPRTGPGRAAASAAATPPAGRSPARGRRTPRRPPAANGARPGYGDRCGSQANESGRVQPGRPQPGQQPRRTPTSTSVEIHPLHVVEQRQPTPPAAAAPETPAAPATAPGSPPRSTTGRSPKPRSPERSLRRSGAAGRTTPAPSRARPGCPAPGRSRQTTQRTPRPAAAHRPRSVTRLVPAAVADKHRRHPHPLPAHSSISLRRAGSELSVLRRQRRTFPAASLAFAKRPLGAYMPGWPSACLT